MLIERGANVVVVTHNTNLTEGGDALSGVFGSLPLVKNLIARADLTIEVLAPKVVTNPNFPNQSSLDWTQPTVEDTVPGTLQPAGIKALERVGRVGTVGNHQLYLARAPLVPLQRVRVKGATGLQYSVLEVRSWPGHVEVLVEEVTP